MSASTQGPQALEVIASTKLHPRIVECKVYSPALGMHNRFVVVLPEGYAQRKTPWPVVYFLHGAGRHCRSLVSQPKTRDALLAAPFVSVHPNGRGGWWIDSPVKPESRYQTHVAEIVRTAEANFNVSKEPKHRGLGGWSMGGYGATLYAQAHPGQFAALATILPLVDFPNPSLPPKQNHSVPPVLGKDPAVWQRFNPIHYAAALRGMAIYHTTGDGAFDLTMNVNFDRRLSALGIEHTFALRPGAHTWSFVEAALPNVLRFLSRATGAD